MRSSRFKRDGRTREHARACGRAGRRVVFMHARGAIRAREAGRFDRPRSGTLPIACGKIEGAAR